jgi:hypothetical protein
MRFATVAIALHIAVAISPLSPAVSAQVPTDSVPTDSVRRDTTASDSVRAGPIHPWWGPLVIPASIVFGAVIAAAPAPLARWVNFPRDMGFMKNHVALHASLGGRFSDGETWANGLSLEIVRKPMLLELRAEDFWRPRHIRYFTARTGYLWHPKRAATGSLTVGYVHAEGTTSQTGLELGLPLFVGRETMTLRFEPAYVISSRGVLWNYRGQAEAYIGGGRYVIGGNVVRKSLRLTSKDEGALSPQAVTLVLGVRF